MPAMKTGVGYNIYIHDVCMYVCIFTITDANYERSFIHCRLAIDVFPQPHCWQLGQVSIRTHTNMCVCMYVCMQSLNLQPAGAAPGTSTA